MADAPETVTEALAVLAEDGYVEDFNVRTSTTVCHRCGEAHPVAIEIVERQYRFEGPSDPGDEAIVLGLRCPACGARGVLVSAFGPDADPELFDAIRKLPGRSGTERP